MKKVLSLVLAVVLAFGMASVAFAVEIELVDQNFSLGECASNAWEGIDLQPAQEAKIHFYLRPSAFGLATTPHQYDETIPATDTWADHNADSDYYTSMTVSNLTSAKYDVTAKKTKGYPALDTVKLTNVKASRKFTNLAGVTKTYTINEVWVELKFIKEMVSVEEEDFEYDIYLTNKKRAIDHTMITVYGTMENPVIDVDEDNDTVDLRDGTVAEAYDFVKDIEIESGNGVFVTLNMFEDCKYYCKSSMVLSKTDAQVMDETVAIEGVVTMKTATSKNATFRSAKVTMELSEKYYVYDADGKYIGVSTDTLPFSSKYYLATTKIDMGSTATEVDGSEPTTPVDPANPTTGGDSTPVNANDNPGTGC